MDKSKPVKLTRPFKLALALAVCSGLGLFLFGQYVAGLDDSPNGRTPLSWSFKSSSQGVSAFFATEEPMRGAANAGNLSFPIIDRVVQEQTRFALFALG